MAAKKKPTPLGDDHYEAMLKSKIAAGLPPETAREVTARQRAEDLANGVTSDEPEPTSEP
jgi:hypothetical protein